MRSRVVLWLSFLFLFTSWQLSSQVINGSRPDRFHTVLGECQDTVHRWDRESEIQLTLTIVVILAGAVITGLQGISKGWVKPLTVALGITTTLFSTINARVFADYRLLQQAAIDGKELIDDKLTVLADQLAATKNDQDRDALWSQWLVAKDQFREIEKRVVQGIGTQMPIDYVPAVHAQALTAEPDWVKHPPIDDHKSGESHNLFFSGQAQNRSFSKAEQQSYDNAIGAALKDISKTPSDIPIVRELLLSSSAKDRDAFTFSKTTGLYSFFTLIRVSDEIRDYQSFRATEPQPVVTVGCSIERPILEEEGESAMQLLVRVPITIGNDSDSLLSVLQVAMRSQDGRLLESLADNSQLIAGFRTPDGHAFSDRVKQYSFASIGAHRKKFGISYFPRKAYSKGAPRPELVILFREEPTGNKFEINTSSCGSSIL